MNELTLFQAVELFVLDKEAAGYSRYTIRNYRNTFAKVRQFLRRDPPLAEMTHARWAAFMAWLQNEYISTPNGVAPRGTRQLSPKSVCNIHTDLSAFYTWAVKRGFAKKHILRELERPRFELPAIEPFTYNEIVQLLKACKLTRTWKNSTYQRQRATEKRDRAIILTLLSTGVLASELCCITIGNVNFSEHSIKVAGKGRGRDSKERIVYVGQRTIRALTHYLAPRLKKKKARDPLFCVGEEGSHRSFTRDVLRRL
ncbi:MAG: phage integrase N-terminal SAM-like domain-containing protein, partial [Anaerolineaceae bacterium]|nr:phage integrase N-terminal SAM-like domain-containing protein [Anaerolineaceae bacterium]